MMAIVVMIVMVIIRVIIIVVVDLVVGIVFAPAILRSMPIVVSLMIYWLIAVFFVAI